MLKSGHSLNLIGTGDGGDTSEAILDKKFHGKWFGSESGQGSSLNRLLLESVVLCQTRNIAPTGGGGTKGEARKLEHTLDPKDADL